MNIQEFNDKIADMETIQLYSNFDNELAISEEEFKKMNKIGTHAAWNYCGAIIWDGQMFYELIMKHRSDVEVLAASTLEELISDAKSEHGYD